MLVALVALIAAILLFGSSPVLGALGWVLGLIAATIAVAVFAFDTGLHLGLAALLMLVIIVVLVLVAFWIENELRK